MAPAPLRLSLLFDCCISHFGFFFQAPFCKWRWFKWRWRWRRRQRRTTATATATSFLGRPPFALRMMSLALRLLILWFLGDLSKTIACSFQSFVTFGGRQQDCFHAGTALNDPPLDVLCSRWHIQGNCPCIQTAQSQFGATALVTQVEIQGTASCGCNTSALIPTLPPSSSGAFGVNSLPSASSSKLPVHRSHGGNRSIVRAFTTPLAVPTSSVFDPSTGPKYLPSSNRESRGPSRQLDGCKSIHHTRSPNCAKEGTARLPTFRSHAVLPSRPTANRRCVLAAYGTSHVNRSWSAGTSTLRLTPLPV